MTILVVELLIIEVISRAGSWILEFGDARGRKEWNRYNNVIKPEQCWGADIQIDLDTELSRGADIQTDLDTELSRVLQSTWGCTHSNTLCSDHCLEYLCCKHVRMQPCAIKALWNKIQIPSP